MITESDLRSWIDAYGDAWMTQDPDKIVKLFTADATYQERRFHTAIRGRDAIRSYWKDLVHDMQRDIFFEAKQLIVPAGDEGFVHWHAHFSWRPINGVLELDAISRITFSPETRDGLRLASAFEEWIDSREA